MPEELKAEIRIEPAPPGAVPFIPEEDRAMLKFELVPEVPKELPELEPYYPAFVPYKPIEYAAPLKADLVINIEATGANPWDSRLIVISIRDPSDAGSMRISAVSSSTTLLSLQLHYLLLEPSDL